MVTEADRPVDVIAADREAWIELERFRMASLLAEIRAGECDYMPPLQVIARHRTASTAALTAEIQRLREDRDRLAKAGDEARTLIDEFNERGESRRFYGIDQTLHSKLCTVRATLAIAAALSTPSEVSDPDQLGGAFAESPGMFDKPNPDEVAGTYSAFEVSEPVADHIGGEGETVSREVDLAAREALFKSATLVETLTPPNTNGDAVREAETPSWRVAGHDSHFGPYVLIDGVKHDQVVVCYWRNQIQPLHLRLPGQAYVADLLQLMDEHQCQEVAIIPVRHKERVSLTRKDLATLAKHGGAEG